MDTEALIREISVRPVLWDRKNRNHHNRFILDKLWEEVALKVNTTRSAARKKWKAIRDKFRTTLSTLPNPGDYENMSTEISWKYFESLLFLQDQFTPREPKNDESNHTYSEAELEDIEDVEDSRSSLISVGLSLSPQYQQDRAIPTPTSSRPSSSLANKRQNRKRQSNDTIGMALLELETKKVKYLDDKKKKMGEEDDDMHFFKSLLPHINKFPSSKKMVYRMKILEITQSFLNATNDN